MFRQVGGLIVASVMLGAVSPARAHHSFAAEFDANANAELSGEISQVWWNNPHVRYRLKTKSADDTAQDWELQAASITSLMQFGWTESTLKVGDKVTVSGYLGRNGAKKLYVRSVSRPDGTKFATSRDEREADPNQVHAQAGKRYDYGGSGNNYPIDITGPWRNRYKWHLTVDDLEPKPTPFTPEGRRVFAATDHYEDAVLRCMPLGLPREFGSPYDMEIVAAGDHYVFLYVEHNTPRRIWMDGRKAAENTPETSLGFSVGRWEGATLVIETTHLAPGWLDGSWLPMSGPGTRIVERYEFSADRLAIDRTMTIYDPYYTQPLVRKRGSARDDALVIAEQAACDPDSYYRDLRDLGRLDKHLDGE
jgi:hypothetical protein